MLELSEEHGAVGVLVVKLKHFHEVLVGTSVLVLLHLRVDGEELIELQLLLLLLGGNSELRNK